MHPEQSLTDPGRGIKYFFETGRDSNYRLRFYSAFCRICVAIMLQLSRPYHGKKDRMNIISKNYIVSALVGMTCVASVYQLQAGQPDPRYRIHDWERPQPEQIDPGFVGNNERTGKAPADAVVLFEGSNLDNWVAMDGAPTKWVVKDGVMECVPGSGMIRTLQCFGDCQLHVEWAEPENISGSSQGRGNSGVFLGGGRYEIQVLDNYNNRTYADGYAGAIYSQYPPEVNPIRKPGEWNTYDIVYIAPRFDKEGNVTSPARITLFFNGVLVQWDRELTGPTNWLSRDPYQAHDYKQPIAFQDHGNPVKFRNVWVREMGCKEKVFKYSNKYLDSLTGIYKGAQTWEIYRDGESLYMSWPNNRSKVWKMTAESPTHFETERTAFSFDFDDFDDQGIPQTVYWNMEGNHNKLTRQKPAEKK